MTKVLLVMTSVRENRIADTILEQVKAGFKDKDVSIDVADFSANPLPLFDHPTPPSAETFMPADKNVEQWTKQVEAADVVVFLTAEYNHTYTAVTKNAIDWVFKEWKDKPVAFIGYGWVGGARAITKLRDLLTGFIQAKLIETEANLAFTQDIELDGAPIGDGAAGKIEKVVEAVTA